ncbi:MAG TPA: hypothetical protein PLX06_13220 [Fimbriimonadaceae bacterium]|nr:hypothetical protein [Fimbriimonadaceae bacterium]
MSRLDEIYSLLDQCSPEERLQVFKRLRRQLHIHPFEQTLNTTAEIILEAISKAPDLTVRGVRGIIAEAAFVVDVVGPLLTQGWRDVTPKGDVPFDSVLEDSVGPVRVQVKMQRRKDHRPMMANEGYRRLRSDLFVTETQRTRGGKGSDGASTRPYRFGEFDILAVSLHPSTNNWSDFVYTVGSWLIPDPKDSSCMLKFQPVSATPNGDWTKDFLECVRWFRSGEKKTIAGIA